MMHPKPSKPRKPSAKTAKARAWKAFSLFIRTRGCIASTGEPDRGLCYTCGRLYDIKDLQAGHFIPGRSGLNLFDERGVQIQDRRCNGPLKGNWIPYRRKMVAQYGEYIVDELQKLADTPRLMKVGDYLDLEAEYKSKLAALMMKWGRGR